MMKWIAGLILTILLWGMCILPASAQKTSTDSSRVKGAHVSESEAAQFGGPSSVGGTLSSDRESEATVPARVDLLDRYFGFKRQVRQEYGFSFGFDYNALLQYATQSLGEDTAAGGVFRVFGQWTLVGRGTENMGTLVYKVENRHRLGTDIAPQDLGFETGYAGLTAITFSDIGWALTNMYWSQRFLDNRLAFVGGVLDVTDYVDTYGLVNPWTDFSNLAFSTNPTIPAPNQGLGAAVHVVPTDNIYILAGIAPRAAMSAIGGGVAAAMSVTGTAEQMRKLVRDNPPGELQKINAAKLAKMGISKPLADAFLNNYAYDPQEKTLLVGELKRLGSIKGREEFIAAAGLVSQHSVALLYRTMARMMAGYHTRVSPVQSIGRLSGTPYLRKKDGTVVLLLPLDFIFQTEEVEAKLKKLDAALKKAGGASGKELWITGRVDESAGKMLEASSWKVVEKATDRL